MWGLLKTKQHPACETFPKGLCHSCPQQQRLLSKWLPLDMHKQSPGSPKAPACPGDRDERAAPLPQLCAASLTSVCSAVLLWSLSYNREACPAVFTLWKFRSWWLCLELRGSWWEALVVGQIHYGELAHGQGSLEQTTPGNSLNSIRSFYLPINARPLPPPSPVAGSAIILAEGSTLIALASAKEHSRASEPLGFWCPQGPGGTELLLWAGLGGVCINSRQTLLTEAFPSVAYCSARPQALQLSISMPSACPGLIYLFSFKQKLQQ